MDFESFWKMYRNDMGQRLRENTLRSKDYIVELKILPYFGKDSKKQFSWPFLNAKIFWISFCQKSQLGMILDTGCGLVS